MSKLSIISKHRDRLRRDNCTCPECGEVFTSRKARHRHQMVTHRKPRPEGNANYSSRRATRERKQKLAAETSKLLQEQAA